MIVVGLDLSLTGLGLVAVPSDWALDFGRVRRERFSTPAGMPLPARLAFQARRVCQWVNTCARGDAVEVFVEGSITGKGETFRNQLKLAGAVEHELYRLLGIVARGAEQSSARKLLLGKLPPTDRKETVVLMLAQLTATRWSADEYDAFVAANFGLAELELPFITFAEAA